MTHTTLASLESACVGADSRSGEAASSATQGPILRELRLAARLAFLTQVTTA